MTVATLDRTDMGRWVELAGPAAALAERIADTEFVPTAMRGKPAVVAAAILYGDELGIGPMQALQGIHVVEGRPQPSAELQRALILRAGHTLTVHEMSGTRVRMSGLRAGRPEAERVTVEWTLDMARAAGLLNRPNWRSYPRAMLTARASGDLGRVLFADVIKGLGHVAEDNPEELEGWAPDVLDGSPPEANARPALQRKRAPRAKATEPPTDAQVGATEAYTAPVAPPIAPPPREFDPEDVPLPPELQPVGTGRPVPATPSWPEEPQPEEPPPEEPAPGVVPRIGPGPLRAVHAAMGRELGTAATRDEKLAMAAAIVGHPLESTKDLTRAEGYDVLAFLDRVADGSAAYDMDPNTGAITVRAVGP